MPTPEDNNKRSDARQRNSETTLESKMSDEDVDSGRNFKTNQKHEGNVWMQSSMVI